MSDNTKNKSSYDEMQIAKRNKLGMRMFMLTVCGILVISVLDYIIEGFNMRYAAISVCAFAMLLFIALQVKAGAFVEANYRAKSARKTIIYAVLLAVLIVLVILRYTVFYDSFPDHSVLDALAGALTAICLLNLVREIAARANQRKENDDD